MIKQLALAVILSISASSALQNPFIGTWKLNPSKSLFGDTPRTSQTTTLTEYQGGLKSDTEIIYDNGLSLRTEWAATLDEKPNTITGDSHYDTIVIKKVDDRTLEVISKKGPTAGRTSRWVVSADGKTMTRTQKVLKEGGEYIENALVFEKQ